MTSLKSPKSAENISGDILTQPLLDNDESGLQKVGQSDHRTVGHVCKVFDETDQKKAGHSCKGHLSLKGSHNAHRKLQMNRDFQRWVFLPMPMLVKNKYHSGRHES